MGGSLTPWNQFFLVDFKVFCQSCSHWTLQQLVCVLTDFTNKVMLLIWTGKDPRGGLEHWKTIFHFKHSHSHLLLQSRKEIHEQKTNYRQRKQTSLFLAYDFFDQVLTEIAGAAASDSLILAPANNLKHQNDKNGRNIEEAFLARWLTCNSVALYYLFLFLWFLLVFFQPYGLPFVRHKKAQNKTVTGEFIRDKMGVKKKLLFLSYQQETGTETWSLCNFPCETLLVLSSE